VVAKPGANGRMQILIVIKKADGRELAGTKNISTVVLLPAGREECRRNDSQKFWSFNLIVWKKQLQISGV
jgi:hypothetical protein